MPSVIVQNTDLIPESYDDSIFSLENIRECYEEFIVNVIEFKDYAYRIGKDGFQFELDFELETLYVSYLCIVGDVNLIKRFLENYNEEEIKIILNNESEFIYYGTPLNESLFWNKDSNAITIYSYLRDLGAVPCKNHYNLYPWEIENENFSWYCEILPMSYNYQRDNREFADTCQKIQEYEKIYTEIYCQEIYRNYYTFTKMIENLDRKEKIKHFLEIVEEELVQKTWNPLRFVNWCLDEDEKEFIVNNCK